MINIKEHLAPQRQGNLRKADDNLTPQDREILKESQETNRQHEKAMKLVESGVADQIQLEGLKTILPNHNPLREHFPDVFHNGVCTPATLETCGLAVSRRTKIRDLFKKISNSQRRTANLPDSTRKAMELYKGVPLSLLESEGGLYVIIPHFRSQKLIKILNIAVMKKGEDDVIYSPAGDGLVHKAHSNTVSDAGHHHITDDDSVWIITKS